MKQFKAKWQKELRVDWHENPIETLSVEKTINHLITQHNALCDYLEGQAGEEAPLVVPSSDIYKTITLPKPEEWNRMSTYMQRAYKEALEAASTASVILFKLED